MSPPPLCLSGLGCWDSVEQGHRDLFGFLELARQLDLDGVDIYTRHFQSIEDDYLARVKQRCAQLELDIVCLAVDCDMSNPPHGRERQLAMAKQAVDAARLLGAPLVEVIAGWPMENESREDAWHAVVEILRDLCTHAQGTGVTVVLQNHNHDSLNRTADDILRMIDDVGRDRIGHLLDTGQYIGSPGATGTTPETRSDDFYACIEKTAPLAQIVRAQTYHGGSREAGQKDDWQIDYDRVMRILKRAGFNGPICARHWGLEPEETGIPKGVDLLRQHLSRWDEYVP